MNKPITLKSLSILTFVIFFLPFMRTCSDDALKSTVKSEIAISNEVEYADVKTDDSVFQKIFSEKKKAATDNFYSLSTLTIRKFDLSNFNELDAWAFVGFTINLIFSILIFYFSLKNNYNFIYLLSFSNLIILLTSPLILSFSILEKLNQIKIGYYLFVLNTVAIIYFSKKLQIKKEGLQ